MLVADFGNQLDIGSAEDFAFKVVNFFAFIAPPTPNSSLISVKNTDVN